MDEVGHIPQTLATRTSRIKRNRGEAEHPADMLKPDLRDTIYKGKQLINCQSTWHDVNWSRKEE